MASGKRHQGLFDGTVYRFDFSATSFPMLFLNIDFTLGRKKQASRSQGVSRFTL